MLDLRALHADIGEVVDINRDRLDLLANKHAGGHLHKVDTHDLGHERQTARGTHVALNDLHTPGSVVSMVRIRGGRPEPVP